MRCAFTIVESGACSVKYAVVGNRAGKRLRFGGPIQYRTVCIQKNKVKAEIRASYGNRSSSHLP